MKALTRYVDMMNVSRNLFNETEISIDTLAQSDVEEICESLSCDLSPESLHCDGEISASDARVKFDFYMRVHQELQSLCKLCNLECSRELSM